MTGRNNQQETGRARCSAKSHLSALLIVFTALVGTALGQGSVAYHPRIARALGDGVDSKSLTIPKAPPIEERNIGIGGLERGGVPFVTLRVRTARTQTELAQALGLNVAAEFEALLSEGEFKFSRTANEVATSGGAALVLTAEKSFGQFRLPSATATTDAVKARSNGTYSEKYGDAYVYAVSKTSTISIIYFLSSSSSLSSESISLSARAEYGAGPFSVSGSTQLDSVMRSLSQSETMNVEFKAVGFPPSFSTATLVANPFDFESTYRELIRTLDEPSEADAADSLYYYRSAAHLFGEREENSLLDSLDINLVSATEHALGRMTTASRELQRIVTGEDPRILLLDDSAKLVERIDQGYELISSLREHALDYVLSPDSTRHAELSRGLTLSLSDFPWRCIESLSPPQPPALAIRTNSRPGETPQGHFGGTFVVRVESEYLTSSVWDRRALAFVYVWHRKKDAPTREEGRWVELYRPDPASPRWHSGPIYEDVNIDQKGQVMVEVHDVFGGKSAIIAFDVEGRVGVAPGPELDGW